MSSRHPMDGEQLCGSIEHGDPTSFDPHGLSLNFVHKRLFRGALGFVTGGPLGAISGVLSGGGSEGRSGSPVIPSGRQPAPGITLGPSVLPRPIVSTCEQRGLVTDARGRCVERAGISGIGPGAGILDPLGIDPGIRVRAALAPTTGGVAVPMIGASAVAPFRETQVVRRCGRGSVLAIDGLCYDRKLLRKDQRMWPPGRKPLLTGGDLNAISRAARAAGRMKTQQKRLQKLGLLPKPKSTRRAPAPVSHHHHD